MTRVTFGVSASSLVANVCETNAVDLALNLLLKQLKSVDDGLTGADSVDEAVILHNQLQNLFDKEGFLLRKWNSSEPKVLQSV